MSRSPIVIAGTIVATIIALAIWQFSPVTHLAMASDSLDFELDCDFSKFRQIMVRKNATEAIVNHGGMTLIDEQVHDLQVDTSKDNRPLLNAIRGRSKTELDVTKSICVQLANAQTRAKELTLRQHVIVGNSEFHVETAALESQDDIKDYQTSLTASPGDNTTRIRLTINMEIEVVAPKLFMARADTRVADAAAKALVDQREAITALVMQYADQRLILPDLGGASS